MSEIVLSKSERELLLGNEAVVRGALEAGVGFVSTYPGTPASEIGDTFAKIFGEVGLYFEYSVNEKVALEAAAGAAFSGVKSLVAMKHYGLNVASDSLLPLAYLKCPLVVVVADDPGCWSSVQTEQDSRWYSRLGKIVTLEPSNPQEVKKMTKQAFDLAWKYRLPVMVRLTTRVCHVRAPVELGELVEPKLRGKFVKPEGGFKLGSKVTLELKERLLEKVGRVRSEVSEVEGLNCQGEGLASDGGRQGKESDSLLRKESDSGELPGSEELAGLGGWRDVGVIASGVSFDYFQEACRELEVDLPWFKIGMSYPFPKDSVAEFLKGKEQVLVIEELDPVIEEEVRRIAGGCLVLGAASFRASARSFEISPPPGRRNDNSLEIHGKDLLPRVGEYRPEDVLEVLVGVLASEEKSPKEKSQTLYSVKSLTLRNSDSFPRQAAKTPTLCAGCPHRATFWAVHKALGEDKITGGDIGCYMLGALPPYYNQDFIVSMGASIGISHGIAKSTGEKPTVFIGDSTFFHAGIPALINMVFNQSNALVIVMDNRLTAMTGQQPHPGSGFRAGGGECKEIRIEEIAKACGADQVEVANVYNLAETMETVRRLYEADGVSVLVARGECRLAAVRKLVRAGKAMPAFELGKDIKVSSPEGRKLFKFGCPAIREKDGKLSIDPELCWGCAFCRQIAPGAVEPRKRVRLFTE